MFERGQDQQTPVGDRIREARRRKGWDAAELARQIRGMGESASHSSIQKLERGWMTAHAGWIRKIANALGVPEDELRYGDPQSYAVTAIPVISWAEFHAGRIKPGRSLEYVAFAAGGHDVIALRARERDARAHVHVRENTYDVQRNDLLICVERNDVPSPLYIAPSPEGGYDLTDQREEAVATVLEIRRPLASI